MNNPAVLISSFGERLIQQLLERLWDGRYGKVSGAVHVPLAQHRTQRLQRNLAHSAKRNDSIRLEACSYMSVAEMFLPKEKPLNGS
ncbi:MAG: hypothetical protein KC592_19760 [Nitrospira sp.]|nr:hypothetical protein [Nitrospira sp.]